MSERQGGRDTLKVVLSKIQAARKILVSGHVRPDGDSIGCMIAMTHLLKQQGAEVVAVADVKRLGGPGFLQGVELLTPLEQAGQSTYDLILTVDCASRDRLPEAVRNLMDALPVVNIDHHRTNTLFGHWNWVNAKAAATAEMIWELVRRAGWPLDQVAAEALWVGLITDTGRFAYDQTTPKTMRCGADLLKYGVRSSFINDNLYCSFTHVAIELRKRALRTLVTKYHGVVASITLTGKDFEETGGTKADVEDLVDIPRSLVDNQVAIFFYGSESKPDITRISVRTREPLDAIKLVSQFGGGGHARAAGCTIAQPLAQAKELFYRAVDELLQEHAIGSSL